VSIEFVEKYLTSKPWDWGIYGLSNNKYITLDFIEHFTALGKPFVWGKNGLSFNPVITPEFVESHIDKDWHWGKWGLSSSINPSIEFVERFADKDWCWNTGGFSSNISVTAEFVDHFSDKDWNWRLLTLNPNITPELVIKYIDKDFIVESLELGKFDYHSKVKNYYSKLLKNKLREFAFRRRWMKEVKECLAMIEGMPPCSLLKEGGVIYQRCIDEIENEI